MLKNICFVVGVLGLSAVARAAGPANVTGGSDRLESIRCAGAYALRTQDVQSVGRAVERMCNRPSGVETDLCAAALIKQRSLRIPGAQLTGVASEGAPTFQLSILDVKGRQAHASTRTAIFDKGHNGMSVLVFAPVGSRTDEVATIETGPLNPDDLSKVQHLTTTFVHAASGKYLTYYFLDGCELSWSKPTL